MLMNLKSYICKLERADLHETNLLDVLLAKIIVANIMLYNFLK